MFSMMRRLVIAGAAAFALASCSGGSGGAGVSPDDMVLGSADAPVTIIEYASATCPHCGEFHHQVWDQLKANYIDTGRVRFVFREYPTPPAQVAVAAFQVARCGGASPEQYFARLGEVFRQQPALFQSLQADGGRAKLIEIGAAAGLTEEQVVQCVGDQAGAARIRRIEEGSRQFNVTGTPTIIINGRKIEDPSVQSYEGLSRMIDAELAH